MWPGFTTLRKTDIWFIFPTGCYSARTFWRFLGWICSRWPGSSLWYMTGLTTVRQSRKTEWEFLYNKMTRCIQKWRVNEIARVCRLRHWVPGGGGGVGGVLAILLASWRFRNQEIRVGELAQPFSIERRRLWAAKNLRFLASRGGDNWTLNLFSLFPSVLKTHQWHIFFLV